MRTIPGLLTALLIGGIVALLLGTIQMLVLHEFRGIVPGILATVGLGIAVGWSTGWGARLWHLRDARIVVALGLLTAILAELVTFWVLAHLLVFAEEGATGPVLVPLGELSVREAVAALGQAVDEGAWHWTRHYHFRGIALILVWVVDVILVLSVSAAFALIAVRSRPYCETCRTWLTRTRRIGPLCMADNRLEEEDDDEVDLEEFLRRLTSEPSTHPTTYLVDLWRCRCSGHAIATLSLARPGSKKLETLVERERISRETHDLLSMRDRPPLLAAQPVWASWTRRRGFPRAEFPDRDSRWVRPCSSCGRKLATGFWAHVNGFAVICPHCDGTHSHPGEGAFLMGITMLTGPLAFFLSMRPPQALLAGLVVVAIFLGGRRWFAGHPSFVLECTFYVALLLGCVIFNGLAYIRQHSGRFPD